MKKWLLILTSLSLMSCSTFEREERSSPTLNELRQKYYDLLAKACAHDEVYEGFQNKFQYTACLLTSDILDMQLDINAKAFLWSAEQYNQKKQELNDKKKTSTIVFLSFFSPERKVDDLNTKASLWRLFLDMNMQRTLGTVMKSSSNVEDVMAQYPKHNAWSTAYEVTFPISIFDVQKEKVNFIITSRVGSSTKAFPITTEKANQ
jgi:hypothetical protein